MSFSDLLSIGITYAIGQFFRTHPVNDHANCRRIMGNGVDQNKGTRFTITFIGIKVQRFTGCYNDPPDLIKPELSGFTAVHGVNIDLITNIVDTRFGHIGRLFDDEIRFRVHLFFIHPDKHSLKMTFYSGLIV